jgi:hypothetical protein
LRRHARPSARPPDTALPCREYSPRCWSPRKIVYLFILRSPCLPASASRQRCRRC